MLSQNSHVKKSYSNKSVVQSYYDKHLEVGLTQPELALIREYVPDVNAKIIDIGCATGRLSTGLNALGYKSIHGIDISSEMIDVARTIAEKNRALTFEVADIVEISASVESYDLAIAFHGITPIPDAKDRHKAIKNIYELLQPKGILICSTFLDDHKPKDIQFEKHNAQIYVHIPTRDSFEEDLRRGGFKRITMYDWKVLMHSREDAIPKAQQCKYWIAMK